MAVTDLAHELEDASLADRVIGRAAALLCVAYGIKEIYARLISKEAIRLLEQNGVSYNYRERTPFIKNREGTGMCPVERMSLDVDDGKHLVKRIEEFLKKNGLLR